MESPAVHRRQGSLWWLPVALASAGAGLVVGGMWQSQRQTVELDAGASFQSQAFEMKTRMNFMQQEIEAFAAQVKLVNASAVVREELIVSTFQGKIDDVKNINVSAVEVDVMNMVQGRIDDEETKVEKELTKLKHESGVTLVGPTWTQCKRNHLSGRIDLSIDYELDLDLKISQTSYGWTNIIHFSADDHDCCNYGDRAPAIWLHSGTSTLYVVTSELSNGNYDKCSPNVGLDTETHLKLKVQGQSQKLFGNGKLLCDLSIGERRALPDAYVWTADPWWAASHAQIKNVIYRKL